MPENYQYYITKNIKTFYKRRLFTPLVYLVLLVIFWCIFSLTDLLVPGTLKEDETLETAYRRGADYVHAALCDLKFTGYTQTSVNRTSGYYYYTVLNE